MRSQTVVGSADSVQDLKESKLLAGEVRNLAGKFGGPSPDSEVSGNYYAELLRRIRNMVPGATLLRGPASLHPAQAASTSSDIDVLVSSEFAKVKLFLKEEGFRRVYKPQTYLERFRRWLPGDPIPYTIDLYKAERWGWGFRLSNNGHRPADPVIASLLHAVADGKGTGYFESQYSGPPWLQPELSKVRFGPLGRALWRSRRTSLLTLYLLAKNVIRPEPRETLRNLFRRAAFRSWQLSRKTGMEIALLGVDGVGKTSVANALLGLPAWIKLIYMGPHDFETRLMRWVARHRVPAIIRQVSYRLDLLARRWSGWLYARKGWIVIYDRHPAEGLDPADHSFRNRVKTALERLHAWPVDHTFWLTGDYRSLYFRKKEYLPEKLRSIDERYGRVLNHYRIPFERIDVTANDLDAVTEMVRNRVMKLHRERTSTKTLPGPLQEILT